MRQLEQWIGMAKLTLGLVLCLTTSVAVSQQVLVSMGGNGDIIQIDGTTAAVGSFATVGATSRGLAVDHMGRVYVARSTGVVERYDASGNYTDDFITGLTSAFDVAIAANGDVLVSQNTLGNVRRYNAAGAFLGMFASGLSDPRGVAVSPTTGDVFVVERLANRVRRYNSSGVHLNDITHLTLPVYVAVDPASGNIAVSWRPGNVVGIHSPTGALLHSVPVSDAVAVGFYGGFLYASSYIPGALNKFFFNGLAWVSVGAPFPVTGLASSGPHGIAFGAEAPILDPVADQNVFEANAQGMVPTTVNVTFNATHPNGVTYAIDATSLAKGMTVNPTTGAFSWSPTELQDGIHSVTVTATNNGLPSLTATTSFNITVAEVNEPPVLGFIGDQPDFAWGSSMVLTATATDPDFVLGVPNTLTFSLEAAPPGASIDPVTGLLVYTPLESDGIGTKTFTVRVTDNGVPALFDEETFEVEVVDPVVYRINGGHRDSINGVALGSTLFVTGSSDNTAKVFDRLTGNLLHTLIGHNGHVTSVALSSDETLVATASDDGSILIWNAATGALERSLLGHAGGVYSIAFSPSDYRLVSGGRDWAVKIWDASTGANLHVMLGHTNQVNSVAWGNGLIVSGSTDRSVRFWDPTTGFLLAEPTVHTGAVTSVAAGLGYFASGSGDRRVYFYDLSFTPTLVEENLPAGVRSLAAGSTFLSAGLDNGMVRTWSSFPPTMYTPHTGPVRGLATDGTVVLSGSVDRTWRIYGSVTTSPTLSLMSTGHTDFITDIDFDAIGSRYVTGSWDGTIKIYSTGGALLRTINAHPGSRVLGVAFAKNAGGVRVASAGEDGFVRVWNANTGALIGQLDHGTPVHDVAFRGTTQTQIFTVAKDGLARRIVISGMTVETTYAGHVGEVISVASNTAGNRVITGGLDGTARIWNAATGALLHTLTGHFGQVTDVGFSSDGTRALTTGGNVNLWNATSGALIWSQIVATGTIAGKLAPDGYTAASLATPFHLRFWRTSDSANAGDRFGETRPAAIRLAWSADGRFLGVVRGDGSTVILDFRPTLPPVPVMASLNLKLQDFVGELPETVTVTVTGSGSRGRQVTGTVDDFGTFALDLEGLRQEFGPRLTVSLKGGTFLTRKVSVDLTRGDVNGRVLHMVNGDANGDDAVNISDFVLVRNAFGSQMGDPNFDPRADLNGDGRVDTLDFLIVRRNFGRMGDR